MSYAMVRVTGLSLDEFAAAAGLHPDLVRRLVALRLVDAASDAAAAWNAARPCPTTARRRTCRYPAGRASPKPACVAPTSG